QPSKPMNSRRCISMTPLKDYAEYSRSAPCTAAKAGTLLSALGQERTSTVHLPMSALPPKADKRETSLIVRFVPKADLRIAAKNGPSAQRALGHRQRLRGIGREDRSSSSPPPPRSAA